MLFFKHPHVANPRLQLSSLEEKCQQLLEPPYDEMVAAHLRCTFAVFNRDFVEAYKCQTVVVQALPIMFAVTLDLRIFANNAELQLKGKGKVGDMLEKAGHMPAHQLLKKYDLMQFADVTKAVSEGNLLLLNEALLKHETFFIRCGIFLILEKLKIITCSSLFRKVYRLLKTHQLPRGAEDDEGGGRGHQRGSVHPRQPHLHGSHQGLYFPSAPEAGGQRAESVSSAVQRILTSAPRMHLLLHNSIKRAGPQRIFLILCSPFFFILLILTINITLFCTFGFSIISCCFCNSKHVSIKHTCSEHSCVSE